MTARLETTSKMGELRQWVEVLQKLTGFGVESVPFLAEKLKVYAEGNVAKLPKGLVTTLRILREFCVAPAVEEGVGMLLSGSILERILRL